MPTFRLNGHDVAITGEGSLLDALRGELGLTTVKDGCSPQGQCGCCTVLIDGQPRVSCVTAARRALGRSVTTPEGLPAAAHRLAQAFDATGASQCGFCSAGIVTRLTPLVEAGTTDRDAIGRALAAHSCRCTGWQPIIDAVAMAASGAPIEARDPDAAARQAELEGGVAQRSGATVALGGLRYAADQVPAGARYLHPNGQLVESRREARAGSVPGRNSTLPLSYPCPAPEGTLRLETTYCDPAALEPDAAVASPSELLARPASNGGAFGASSMAVTEDAQRMARSTGEVVAAVWSREQVVAHGTRRPPLGISLDPDGQGTVVVPSTLEVTDRSALEAALVAAYPDVEVAVAAATGPTVSFAHRGTPFVELEVVATALGHRDQVRLPITVRHGAATVTLTTTGAIAVEVRPGQIWCAATLTSYVCGAVHQGLSWVLSEGVAIDATGAQADVTIRSFGVLPAKAMPEVRVELSSSDEPARPVSRSVLIATAAAVWLAEGLPLRWPTRTPGSLSLPLWICEDA